MWIVRLVAVVFSAALLSGAACMPVHSERPLGEKPVRFAPALSPVSGVWCTPGGILHSWIPHTELNTTGSYCWLVSVIDDANGLLAVKRLLGGRTAVVNLYARASPTNSDDALFFASDFLFLSEEDAVLKGSYLWALAHFTAPDQLLVWFTDKKRKAFVQLVQTGELPGRIVEPREGRSGVWDEKVEQTVILGDLKEEHLKLII
jgi:hypothetical protein